MAYSELRETLRTNLCQSREKNRYNALASRRKALNDLVDLGRTVTESEVVNLGNKLKSKSSVEVTDLALLRLSFIQKEKNMETFLRVKDSLKGLVRELSSHKTKHQLAAAECICNLALGSPWTCLQVAKAAGPYLIIPLSGNCFNMISVNIWALGNLVGSDEKTWNILNAQGFMAKLLSLIRSHDDAEPNTISEEVHQNSLLALVQFLLIGRDLLTADELKDIAETIAILRSSTSSKGYRVSEYILSCTQPGEDVLIKHNAIYKCLCYMNKTEPNEETVASFTSALRTVANLSVGSAGCLQVFEQWSLLGAVVEKIFSLQYSHLINELGWLVANLINHPQCKSEFTSDLRAIEMRFATCQQS